MKLETVIKTQTTKAVISAEPSLQPRRERADGEQRLGARAASGPASRQLAARLLEQTDCLL